MHSAPAPTIMVVGQNMTRWECDPEDKYDLYCDVKQRTTQQGVGALKLHSDDGQQIARIMTIETVNYPATTLNAV